jgi:hypothetical protein
LKHTGPFTTRSISHLISQTHGDKLSVAPLKLNDGGQEMPDAKLWPKDIRKVDAAARYLQDRLITSCAQREIQTKGKAWALPE